jgi:hypothetical protein
VPQNHGVAAVAASVPTERYEAAGRRFFGDSDRRVSLPFRAVRSLLI